MWASTVEMLNVKISEFFCFSFFLYKKSFIFLFLHSTDFDGNRALAQMLKV